MNAIQLRKKMAERGLDAKQLAEKVGLSESYIKLITRGLSPARHTIRLLALVLECSVADLMREEPDRSNATA